MLRDEDDKRIEHLKRRLRAKSKVDVVRRGLELLERDTDRQERIARWKHAALLVRDRDPEVARDFQLNSRFARGE
jgi:Arc/MetJ-type ribon-helix-helix transcriptional regulator